MQVTFLLQWVNRDTGTTNTSHHIMILNGRQESYRKLLRPLLRCYSHHIEETRDTEGIS